MKLIIALIAVVGLFVWWEDATQRRRAAMQAQRNCTLFDMRERCAKQARQKFVEDGWEKPPYGAVENYVFYGNHYSETQNRCFMQLENNSFPMTTVVISDAFEGKVYGTYQWRADAVKKYWEVPPITCKVTSVAGVERACSSRDEFDQLAKTYMEK